MIPLDTPDSRGYTPDLSIIGTHWVHPKHKTKYIIYGFEFDAEHDIWVYQYRDYGVKESSVPNTAPFTRSPRNFHEHVEKFGSERFVRADVEG